MIALVTIQTITAHAQSTTNDIKSVTVINESAITADIETKAENIEAGKKAEGEPAKSRNAFDFLKDATFNVLVDGNYLYNFNDPIGRINLLRVYDPMSNNFNLNAAGLVLELAPDVEKGRRVGFRLDLMYGQMTETLQGSSSSELRPQTYRPVVQAYGTYVAPIGKGLTVDFGKFASPIGLEGIYSKDQINYSRSLWYYMVPFYHMGVRSNYTVNDKLNLTYLLVNGIGQIEDFNGFKSQALLVNIKPTKTTSFNINYYSGQENRDEVPDLNPTFPTVPTQPGIPVNRITPTPDGRSHFIDSYGTWRPTEKWTMAYQADYIVSRFFNNSQPAVAVGGAGYIKYQFAPKFSLAGRFEYLDDKTGAYTTLAQDLKEYTFTADYKLADNLLMKAEYRRDYSNRPFFLTDKEGVLKKDQNTVTLGLMFWFGGKEGSW